MNTKYSLMSAAALLSLAMFTTGFAGVEESAMPSFKSLDKNSDSFISGKETMSLRSVVEDWKIYDANKDGRLSLAEYSVFALAETYVPVPNAEEPVFGAAPY